MLNVWVTFFFSFSKDTFCENRLIITSLPHKEFTSHRKDGVTWSTLPPEKIIVLLTPHLSFPLEQLSCYLPPPHSSQKNYRVTCTPHSFRNNYRLICLPPTHQKKHTPEKLSCFPNCNNFSPSSKLHLKSHVPWLSWRRLNFTSDEVGAPCFFAPFSPLTGLQKSYLL